jgi:hypothetical protein
MLLGARGIPRGRGQLAHSLAGPITPIGQDIAQIFPEIKVQAAAGFHNGGDGGDLRSGLRAADVQPVFAAYLKVEYHDPTRAAIPVPPLPIAQNNLSANASIRQANPSELPAPAPEPQQGPQRESCLTDALRLASCVRA